MVSGESEFVLLTWNAVEVMEDEGRLEISAREHENGIIIEVSDTGTGIPESEMENLFKPFHTTKLNGTSLESRKV